ncbi:pentapeptide repeat-containing protein [Streptomyces althioticus]|jgi:uncharacterized protein YjbI with pentapeptide repeats|uniref:pentapeptide repeat-containing protein n=1 Tax=Streptomyces althioticus TaxID=83380 RepID=UPI0036FB8DB8
MELPRGLLGEACDNREPRNSSPAQASLKVIGMGEDMVNQGARSRIGAWRRRRNRVIANRRERLPQMANLVTMVTALGALIFTGLSLQQTRIQNQVAESGQVTDRFNSAIENLKSGSLDIRLGGIYALQRLMHDSPRDQAAIVKILAAYIRGHDRPLDAKPPKSVLEIAEDRAGVSLHLVPDDVEAAVRVIADRDPAHDGLAHRGNVALVIDLSGAHLEGVDLSDANLDFVNFAGAHLDYAKLRKVSLIAANFERASLKDADFTGSDTRSASFREAQLTGAQFQYVDAEGADFSGAGSARAVLAAEDLRAAYLVRTELCRSKTPLKAEKGYRCDEHLT